jgi:hypothetical protein
MSILKELENLHKIPTSAMIEETEDIETIISQDEESDHHNIFEDEDQEDGERVSNDTTNVNGEFITADIVLSLANTVIPIAMVLLFDKTLEAKVDKRNFVLTAAEKKTLEPIVQKCLATLNMNFESPFTALAVVGGIIYGTKAVNVYSQLDLSDRGTLKEKVRKETAGSTTKRKYTVSEKVGRPRKN